MAVWDSKKKGPVRELRVAGRMREVEFTLNAPDARSVYVAGSFNDWDTKALPLKKYRDGTWRAKIDLPIGRHEYKYFIDGAWAQDTPCTEKIPNTFGTENCAIDVS